MVAKEEMDGKVSVSKFGYLLFPGKPPPPTLEAEEKETLNHTNSDEKDKFHGFAGGGYVNLMQ